MPPWSLIKSVVHFSSFHTHSHKWEGFSSFPAICKNRKCRHSLLSPVYNFGFVGHNSPVKAQFPWNLPESGLSPWPRNLYNPFTGCIEWGCSFHYLPDTEVIALHAVEGAVPLFVFFIFFLQRRLDSHEHTARYDQSHTKRHAAVTLPPNFITSQSMHFPSLVPLFQTYYSYSWEQQHLC